MAEKKILVVDYDAGSLDQISKLLKSHKYSVVRAADGQAGYEAFRTEKPDLVVVEAMLPKLHGLDLTQKISRESQGKVPVILITGLYKGPQFLTLRFDRTATTASQVAAAIMNQLEVADFSLAEPDLASIAKQIYSGALHA